MAEFRVRILAAANGVPVHNVMHVTGDPGDEPGIATDVANAWRNSIHDSLHVSYTFQGVEVENANTDNAGAFAVGTTRATIGTLTGTALPTFVCASVRLQTTLRGRAGAGRLGLGPLPETFTADDANSLTTAAASGILTNVNAFITDLANSSRGKPIGLVVASYYKGVDAQGKPIKRPSPVFTPVTSVSVNSVLGTRLSRHPNR